jgi:hypothetical protein
MTIRGTFRGSRPVDLDATKLRLVREAIQQNIQEPFPVGRRTEAPPRLSLPALMAGSFLIAVLVYLSMPSAVDSKGAVAAANPSSVGSVEPTVPAAGSRMHEAEVLAAAPRRLSRAVLPLSVRRIVLDAGHGDATRSHLRSGVSEKDNTSTSRSGCAGSWRTLTSRC